MNSRSSFGTGFKSPMMINNLQLMKQVFDDSVRFISTLKINYTNIFFPFCRHTFALGFEINTQSYYHLAQDLLYKKDNTLKYFLTYKCSQDHLELYFSCIRRRGGWNDNSNVLQFKWALRQHLFGNTVRASLNANCLDYTFETHSILQFRQQKRNTYDYQISQQSEKYLNINNVNLSYMQENILYYIAGTIVRTLLKKINCHHCANMLIEKKVASYDTFHNYTIDVTKYNSFTTFVNRGQLYYPSSAVFKIVEVVEKAFRTELAFHSIQESNFKRNIVMRTIQILLPNMKTMFFPEHPVIDNTGDEDLHETLLVKIIALKL